MMLDIPEPPCPPSVNIVLSEPVVRWATRDTAGGAIKLHQGFAIQFKNAEELFGVHPGLASGMMRP